MLKKFISIKNVGKFRNCVASGDIEFRRLSLVYAENGRGKTTLSAILRSLQLGDPLFITERNTLDGNGTSQVDLLTDSGKLSFDGTTWTQQYQSLAIFDSTYISENVYSGDFVELDHKKRLYHVTIEKEGVSLALKVNDCDGKSRELASQIKAKRDELARKLPKGANLDGFLSLTRDDAVEQNIVEKQNEIVALTDAESIKAKAALTRFILPAVPPSLGKNLSETLKDISKDAERKVRQEILKHQMGDQGQGWLSLGLKFLHGDTCPFCDQNIKGNDLVAAYKSFFDAGYRIFKESVQKFDLEFRRLFSDKQTANLKTSLVQNSANQEFWNKYIPIDLPTLDFENTIEPTLKDLASAVIGLLDKKTAAPLDDIPLSAGVQGAIQKLDGLSAAINAYNLAVDTANGAITALKKKTETGNAPALRKELADLELKKLRQSPEVSALCGELQTLQDQKKAVEGDKDGCKKQLDEHPASVFQQYEKGINKLLERFSAGFCLVGVKQQYLGGSPSSTFKLSINGVAVDLRDSNLARGVPCFRNTMSSGDRNTVALAFFIAQLQQRSDIANLTIVFDDPFTSLDRFRQQFTRDQIRSLAKKAKQVIVLSHEPSFLELIADGFDSAELRLLIVARDGLVDSTIRPWDMKAKWPQVITRTSSRFLLITEGSGMTRVP